MRYTANSEGRHDVTTEPVIGYIWCAELHIASSNTQHRPIGLWVTNNISVRFEHRCVRCNIRSMPFSTLFNPFQLFTAPGGMLGVIYLISRASNVAR